MENDEPCYPLHQSADLVFDFENRRVYGECHLTIGCKDDVIPDSSVFLHARQMRILQVNVNGLSAEFEHLDPLSMIADSEPVRTEPFDIDRIYRASLEFARRGELKIKVPKIRDGFIYPLPTPPKDTPYDIVKKYDKLNNMFIALSGGRYAKFANSSPAASPKNVHVSDEMDLGDNGDNFFDIDNTRQSHAPPQYGKLLQIHIKYVIDADYILEDFKKSNNSNFDGPVHFAGFRFQSSMLSGESNYQYDMNRSNKDNSRNWEPANSGRAVAVYSTSGSRDGVALDDVDGVRCWLPCLDETSQRPILDLMIYAPSEKTIVATGIAVEKVHNIRIPRGQGPRRDILTDSIRRISDFRTNFVQSEGALIRLNSNQNIAMSYEDYQSRRFISRYRVMPSAIGFFIGNTEQYYMPLYRMKGLIFAATDITDNKNSYSSQNKNNINSKQQHSMKSSGEYFGAFVDDGKNNSNEHLGNKISRLLNDDVFRVLHRNFEVSDGNMDEDDHREDVTINDRSNIQNNYYYHSNNAKNEKSKRSNSSEQFEEFFYEKAIFRAMLGFEMAQKHLHRLVGRNHLHHQYNQIYIPGLQYDYIAFDGLLLMNSPLIPYRADNIGVTTEATSSSYLSGNEGALHATQMRGYLASWLLASLPFANYTSEYIWQGILGYLHTLYLQSLYDSPSGGSGGDTADKSKFNLFGNTTTHGSSLWCAQALSNRIDTCMLLEKTLMVGPMLRKEMDRYDRFTGEHALFVQEKALLALQLLENRSSDKDSLRAALQKMIMIPPVIQSRPLKMRNNNNNTKYTMQIENFTTSAHINNQSKASDVNTGVAATSTVSKVYHPDSMDFVVPSMYNPSSSISPVYVAPLSPMAISPSSPSNFDVNFDCMPLASIFSLSSAIDTVGESQSPRSIGSPRSNEFFYDSEGSPRSPESGNSPQSPWSPTWSPDGSYEGTGLDQRAISYNLKHWEVQMKDLYRGCVTADTFFTDIQEKIGIMHEIDKDFFDEFTYRSGLIYAKLATRRQQSTFEVFVDQIGLYEGHFDKKYTLKKGVRLLVEELCDKFTSEPNIQIDTDVQSHRIALRTRPGRPKNGAAAKDSNQYEIQLFEFPNQNENHDLQEVVSFFQNMASYKEYFAISAMQRLKSLLHRNDGDSRTTSSGGVRAIVFDPQCNFYLDANYGAIPDYILCLSLLMREPTSGNAENADANASFGGGSKVDDVHEIMFKMKILRSIPRIERSMKKNQSHKYDISNNIILQRMVLFEYIIGSKNKEYFKQQNDTTGSKTDLTMISENGDVLTRIEAMYALVHWSNSIRERHNHSCYLMLLYCIGKLYDSKLKQYNVVNFDLPLTDFPNNIFNLNLLQSIALFRSDNLSPLITVKFLHRIYEDTLELSVIMIMSKEFTRSNQQKKHRQRHDQTQTLSNNSGNNNSNSRKRSLNGKLINRNNTNSNSNNDNSSDDDFDNDDDDDDANAFDSELDSRYDDRPIIALKGALMHIMSTLSLQTFKGAAGSITTTLSKIINDFKGKSDNPSHRQQHQQHHQHSGASGASGVSNATHRGNCLEESIMEPSVIIKAIFSEPLLHYAGQFVMQACNEIRSIIGEHCPEYITSSSSTSSNHQYHHPSVTAMGTSLINESSMLTSGLTLALKSDLSLSIALTSANLAQIFPFVYDFDRQHQQSNGQQAMSSINEQCLKFLSEHNIVFGPRKITKFANLDVVSFFLPYSQEYRRRHNMLLYCESSNIQNRKNNSGIPFYDGFESIKSYFSRYQSGFASSGVSGERDTEDDFVRSDSDLESDSEINNNDDIFGGNTRNSTANVFRKRKDSFVLPRLLWSPPALQGASNVRLIALEHFVNQCFTQFYVLSLKFTSIPMNVYISSAIQACRMVISFDTDHNVRMEAARILMNAILDMPVGSYSALQVQRDIPGLFLNEIKDMKGFTNLNWGFQQKDFSCNPGDINGGNNSANAGGNSDRFAMSQDCDFALQTNKHSLHLLKYTNPMRELSKCINYKSDSSKVCNNDPNLDYETEEWWKLISTNTTSQSIRSILLKAWMFVFNHPSRQHAITLRQPNLKQHQHQQQHHQRDHNTNVENNNNNNNSNNKQFLEELEKATFDAKLSYNHPSPLRHPLEALQLAEIGISLGSEETYSIVGNKRRASK